MEDQAVNGAVVESVDLELVGMLGAFFERMLDAIDLVTDAVRLAKQLRRVGGNDLEIPIEALTEHECIPPAARRARSRGTKRRSCGITGRKSFRHIGQISIHSLSKGVGRPPEVASSRSTIKGSG